MVRIYKNLHDRNGRQAGVQLFPRSISIRRTSEARFIYSPTRMILLFATLRCSTQIGTSNSNLLEHVAKFWFLFFLIKRGKTSSVSDKHNIIAQYSHDINTLQEISDGLKLSDNAYTSIHHVKVPQTQSQSERHYHMVIILFLKFLQCTILLFQTPLLQA